MRKRIFSLVLSILMLLCLFPAVAVAEQDAWGVIGNICGTNWDTDFPMTEIEPNIWKSDELELHAGEMLKVRLNGSWDMNYGIDFSWDGNEPVICCQGGRNLVIPADGTYVVTLSLGEPTTIALTCDGETVLPQIEQEEPGSDVWTVIGSIFGSNWDTDYQMTEIEAGVWQAGPWTMEADWEFRVRCNFDWEWNYGAADGENCVIEEDGVYRITLDLNVENPAVTWELTDDEPEEPVVVQPDDPGEEYERVPLTEENFPDANFRAWILAQDGWTEAEDGVTYLSGGARENEFIDCSGQGIADLTGIQYFPNLRYLIAGECYDENENGDWVLAGSNALTSFDASLAPNLVELSVTLSDVTELDVSPLTNLERLWCAGNGMTSLTLGDLPHLEYLNAGDCGWYEGNDEWGSKKNRLSELDLSGVPNLKELNVNGNLLTALDLSGVPNLKELNVNGNLLTALDASGFADLKRLECADNPITSLTLPDHKVCGWLGICEVEPTDNGNGTYSFDLSTLLDPTAYSFESIDTSEWDESKSLNTETGVVTFAYVPDWEQFCVKETVVFEGEDWQSTEDLWLNIDFVGGDPYNPDDPQDPDDPDYPYVSDEGIDPSTEYNSGGEDGTVPDWRPTAPAYDGSLDGIPIDEEHFPDANFREWILRKLDHETVTDGETGEETYLLTGEQRWNVTVIDCRGRHIQSLAGIEYFPNLEWLYCGRVLTEYVPEYAFFLYASNPIETLDLSGNPKLTRLYASYCRLTAIDLSLNPELTHLSLFHNALTALDLSNNNKIEELSFEVNDIASFTAPEMPNLRILRCGFTRLVEVDLSGRSEMTSVRCHNIDTLETLNINGCTSLDPTECEIHDNYALRELRCRNCGLSEIPNNIPNLEILDCGGNEQFTSLDLSDLRELKELYCDNCSLYRLNLSLNRNITILNCSYNHLKELNFILVPGTQEYGGEFYGQGQTAVCAAGMEPDGDGFTFDMHNLVSAENLDRILSVSGASSFDPQTGIATFAEAADTISYAFNASDDQGVTLSMPVTVTLNVEMPPLPDGAIPIDKEHFPDDNFRNWILKSLTPYYTEDEFGRQYLTETRYDAYYFDLTGMEIASIEGLEYFPNAFGLFLGDGYRQDEDGDWVWHSNYLTEVDLSQNPNLAEVHLNNNRLTSLDVSGLSRLQWLNCRNNRLNVIDVSQNANLAMLWCGGNNATVLTLPGVHVYPLLRAQSNQLARIECEDNQIESLDLAGLAALKELNCEHNQIAALDLAGNTNFGLLDCDENVDVTLPEGMAFCAEMTINDDEKTYRCTSLAAAIDKITGRDGVTSADEVQSAYITLFDDQEGPALVFDPNQRKTVVIDLGGHTYAAWEKPVLVAYENDVTVKNGEIVFKPTPTFTTQSLILSGQIGLSFNMDLPDIEGVNWENSYMTFTIPHGTCTERADYTDSQMRSSGTKPFVCYVATIQMAEPITATFHWTEGEEEKTVEKTYAIKDYFLSYDENKDLFDPNTQKLIESTADYGHYVQAYLADVKGWALGENGAYYEMDKFYTEAYNYNDTETGLNEYGFTCVNDGADITKLSFATVLDSATTIRLPITPTSGYTGTFAAEADQGKEATVSKSGNRYIVEIPNLAAHELSKVYTITVTTEGGTATITTSALSYMKLLFNANETAPVRNAASAMLGYASAAYSYQNAD